MRRSWAAALAALVAGLVLVGVPTTAQAASTADACGDTTAASRDLSEVRFVYSASSFQVRTVMCGQTYESTPSGSWQVTVHLTSFSPEVQLSAVMGDYGKYADWTGFYACLSTSCPVGTDGNGYTHPAGHPIVNDRYWTSPDEPSLSARTGFGYDSWSDVLPAGTAIPDTVQWYAEVRSAPFTDPSTSGPPLDRAPDTGPAQTGRNTAPIATTVTASPGPAPTWLSVGGLRTDTGRLTTSSGAAVPNRLVVVTPSVPAYPGQHSTAQGQWSTSYRVPHNTPVTASFPGDGVYEPSTTSPYPALVKAFVSLDLAPRTSVARGHGLVLRGVVRPHQPGQVRVLIREDRPGATYRLLRYTSLVQNGDSYYRTTWSPAVRGRYVLRTLWNGGSTAPGSVVSNISTYRYVTVR